MGLLHHVLHTGARPIGVSEFMDAVRAICPPRFPQARGTLHRRVAIAVSGGVDSMALAFLCSGIRRINPDFMFADNPVSGFRGIVVDHGLRPGSREEGLAVCNVLQDMGFFAELATLNWTRALADTNYAHPKDLPNFESVARTLRYRRIGWICAYRRIATLLLAHHEDDQYETVFMRLMQGHGSRGLRGMRKANAIPECGGVFGADWSGFVDDQNRKGAYYNTRPSRKQRRHMQRELRSSFHDLMAKEGIDESAATEDFDVDLEEFYKDSQAGSFQPDPIEIEDGGVTAYRPLLEFSKDRLIATCLENKVPWWEDATNKDQTITMRNAVRHMYKGYSLPKALQKPAILELSNRCERRVQSQEAEANRLLAQTTIHGFEPLSGTVTVQFPKYESHLARRDARSRLRREARFSKRREVAAIVIRKILTLVSPDSHPPLLTTLENFVSRLFPSLAGPSESATISPPKAFTVAGVHLVPIQSAPNPNPTSSSGYYPESTCPSASDTATGQQLTWYLSRAPYPSQTSIPLPRVRTPYWATRRTRKGVWRMSPRMRWALWDGRYWLHVEHRLPYRLVVQPFLREHAKPFREQLEPEDRKRLAAWLKRYAPGKVRYTLPGIYLEEKLDLNDVRPRKDYPYPLGAGEGAGGVAGVGGDGDVNTSGLEEDGNWNRGEKNQQDRTPEEGPDPASLHPKVLDVSKMQLLALPTLGIDVPRLEEWLSYEIRYRRMDRETLSTAGTFNRGSFAASRAAKRSGVMRGARSTGRGRARLFRSRRNTRE
ncbi:adenine nucleotide alpha hydrolases-like protein [Hypoxylon sp. NC1633]|nr:adenine nucleotide alpha hydrolases-like protein [Hypoxylon sp. NC1633]